MYEATLDIAQKTPNFMLQLQTSKEYETLIPEIDTRIVDLQNQLNAAGTVLQKLKDTEMAMATAEAAVVQPAVTPAPIVVTAQASIPTPIVTVAIAPIPAPVVMVAPAPEVRGQPGITPIAEAVITPTPEVAAVSLAGMPSWTWILIAGAAIFFIFGGKELEGKKPKRVRRRQ